MAKWVQQTLSNLNTEEFEAKADDLIGVVSGVASILDFIGGALQIVAALLFAGSDPITALVESALNAAEQFIVDLMQNNVAVCVHTNLHWNKRWTFNTSPDDPDGPNYTSLGQLPWNGTGLQGWLQEVLLSANDESNIWRPLTDAETEVTGTILIHGVPGFDELESLQKIFKIFTDLGDFEQVLDIETYKDMLPNKEALARLGPACSDAYMAALVAVFTPIYLEKWHQGDPPYWVSVPFASLMPPLQNFFDALRQIIDSLRPASTPGDMLDDLGKALERKAALLDELAEELEDLKETIAALLDLFDNAYILYLTPEAGGMNNFILRAQQAEDMPDFGSGGIVAGLVMLATQENAMTTLDTFWSLFKLDVNDLISSAELTQAQENLDAQYDELQQELEDEEP